MNDIVKNNIFNTIKAYDRIVISRHTRPDGDAIGSTHGMAELLRASFPGKDIRVISEDGSDYLAFLGPDDTADDTFFEGALGIVIDTGTMDRISNSRIRAVRELIKIDHHIDDKPYGDISWVEEERSSACEMIVDFYLTFRNDLVLTPQAALPLYAGMVSDSGRFRFPSVSGETLRLAAVLLDTGIDTETLFANLYLEEYAHFKYEAYVYEHMQITENGVAYLFVTQEMQDLFRLDREAASNTISYLDSIRGSIIWLAFIDNGDGSIRVRLRSRFVTVQELASHYHGGGHDRASGATVYSWQEAESLLAEADELSRLYKETHEDWL